MRAPTTPSTRLLGFLYQSHQFLSRETGQLFGGLPYLAFQPCEAFMSKEDRKTSVFRYFIPLRTELQKNVDHVILHEEILSFGQAQEIGNLALDIGGVA